MRHACGRARAGMSLKPLSTGHIPKMTSLVTLAAFPQGNLYTRRRDESGTLYLGTFDTAVE
jgi:hypothetical protein